MAPIQWEKTGHLWSCHFGPEIMADWFKSGKKLYAVLDACDEPIVLQIVADLGGSAVSLYHGKAAQDYASFAPYLVSLNELTLQTIQTELAASAWGFVAGTTADKTLADVRRHFRQYLKVRSPEGKELFFRFYDPRFLPTFLQSLEEQELMNFLGPLQFVITIQNSSVLKAYTTNSLRQALNVSSLPLSSTDSNPQE